MSLVRYLNVLLLLAVLANCKVEADKDVSATCQRLDEEARKEGIDKEIGQNSEKFHNFAVTKLDQWTSRLKAFTETGDDLHEALEEVYPFDGCYADTLENVATIAKCDPDRFESMSDFSESVRMLATDCFTPKYIGWKVRVTRYRSPTYLPSLLLPSCMKGVSVEEFLDQSFIDQYQEDNLGDSLTNLTEIETGKAVSSLVGSITRELAKKGKTPAEMNFAHDHKALGSYLGKYLYKPCKNFVGVAKSTVDSILVASRLYRGGLEKLLSKLSKSTQEDLFRYTLCKKLIDEARPEEVAKDVAGQFLI